jgi:hypothetical protein
MNRYAVSNGRYKITSKTDFGFFSADQQLLYFNGQTDKASLKVVTTASGKLELDIRKWGPNEISLTQSSKDAASNKLVYQINDLKPDSYYTVLVNNKTLKRAKSAHDGSLIFDYKTNRTPDEIIVLNK